MLSHVNRGSLPIGRWPGWVPWKNFPRVPPSGALDVPGHNYTNYDNTPTQKSSGIYRPMAGGDVGPGALACGGGGANFYPEVPPMGAELPHGLTQPDPPPLSCCTDR